MIKPISVAVFAICNLFCSPAFSDPITSSAVAYYPLNNSAVDLSLNAVNGTNFGATFTNDRYGQANSALNLDGIDDYVRIPDAPSQNISGNLTIAAWINIPTPLIDGRIIYSNMQEISPGNGFSLRTSNPDAQSRIKLIYQTSGTHLFSNDFLPYGEWVHVAATFQGTTATMWINGVQSGSGAMPVAPVNLLDQSIGASYSPFYFFQGQIDDVALFDRALNVSEIQELAVVPEPTGIAAAGCAIAATVMLLKRRRNEKSL